MENPLISSPAGSIPSYFRGKRALVTGGSRGIGAAISQHLAACGAHVFINYRDDDASAHFTLQEIGSGKGTATLIKANLLRPDEIRNMFQQIGNSGGLDFLVHNAALGSFKPVMKLRPNQWDLSLNINARALLVCAQEASKLMAERGGKVVSISSLGSSRVIPHYGAIGISKAALESLTRYLAVELAPLKISVNAICAGVVDTESIRRHPLYKDLISRVLQQTPSGRLASPEDIAKVVLFLCSPLADWICGQTLTVDGGMSLNI
jgi:enoyl-[acyl-carrier protein] reductase III